MDLNTKIIEGVKEFPSLYDDKGNLDQRNKAWMQLAEKLKMHEVYLKIRWHSLMQAYQRNMNFKYANYMDFVTRNKNAPDKGDSWPEFIITEDDLKEDRTGHQQEDFVFLEIDEEDTKVKELPQERVMEKVTEKSKQIEDTTSLELKNPDLEKTVYEIQNIKNTKDEKVTQSFELKENETDKPKKIINSNNTTAKVEEKMAAIDVNKVNDLCIKETKEVAIEKPQAPNERCEDVIFGELVSAILKRMDKDKKQNVKKEIMNLLFS